MGKRIRQVIMAILFVVFIGSAVALFIVYRRYENDSRLYGGMADAFTSREDTGAPSGTGENSGEGTSLPGAEPDADPGETCAPISVDFEGLKEINDDIIGWIYCEDTVINYPVLQGPDNDFYLRRSYEKTYLRAGSIFVDAGNRRDFGDSNTIIYGHHMKDKSMFAGLDAWAEQEYYENHPVMWLLTPDQDYKIVLFSGYTISAHSDTYTIFTGPCAELDDYLQKSAEQSDFKSDIVPDGREQYVLLSTCAYDFEDARYVLHGILVPVSRAGETTDLKK